MSLMERIFCLVRLWGSQPVRPRKRPPKARLAVMQLEDRLVPATIFWEGDVSDNWNVAANWDLDRIPGIGDRPVLGTIAAGNHQPVLHAGTDKSVDGIDVQPGFAGKTLTINGSLKLTGATFWDKASTIAGTGSLSLTHNFFWQQGTISVENLYVHGTGHVQISGDAMSLTSATVTIGADKDGAGSAGTMTLASGTAMNNNLQLAEGAIIYIKQQGLLDLRQGQNSAIKGGINGGSRIENEGTLRRNVTDQFGEPVYLTLAVTNKTSTAKLVLDANCALWIDDPSDAAPSLLQIAGRTELGPDSTLYASDEVVIEGGDFVAKSKALGQATVTVSGHFSFYGGNVIVGDGAEYVKLRIANDFYVTGSGTLQVNVDGGLNNTRDYVDVGGVFRQVHPNNILLQVTTDFAAPAAGNTYDIIVAATIEALGDFGRFSWLGMEQVGYTHAFGADSYRLTK